MAKLTPSSVQFSVEDEWVVVSSVDTDSDGVISLDDDDADSLEQSALSSSSGNHQGLGSVQGHDAAHQTLGRVQGLDGVDQILGSIQYLDGVEESAGIIHDFGGVDETLGVIRGHGGTFDQYGAYYDGASHQEEADLDEDYDKGDEAYGLDDELVPWAVSGKFGRQRMRKLGKRACAKMHTSKRSPSLYVKPGCVRGKHGLGLKHNY